jgi:UDP-N-acetylmuramoyl-L-alanyl-D-glutamate--2,6-diaminopimelate ligase
MPKSIKDALSEIKAIDGRFEIIKQQDLSVIIDYAHTPLALDNLLKNININKNTKQNIILVFGCGGDRDRQKRPKMAQIAKKYASKTIVTTDNSRSEDPQRIINDIICGFGDGGYGVIIDRAEAIRYAIRKANKNDIVVIAGKGHERYIQDSTGYRAFDERNIVRQALNERYEKVL